MFTAEILFPKVGESEIEAIESLMSTWYKNGQVVEWQTAMCDDGIRVFALLPRQNAVDSANNNVYAAKEYQILVERGLVPVITMIASDPSLAEPCVCHERSSLVLFTNYCSKGSPVRCGDCFGPVPLYELPHTWDHEHLNVLQWADDYRACDTLQMHCTTGERFGEQQMSRLDSSLSQNGREIAKKMAELTEIPVYYYLAKGRGSTLKHEKNRRCPSCDGEWLLEHGWHDLFDFRCDNCYLLSNIAFSVRT